jgi:hypothetical protein
MRKSARHYRTKKQMGDVLGAIRRILNEAESQITVRHLFYRLVGLGMIPKTESAYQLLGRHLSKWRRSEEIPWSSFADNTRWHIRQPSFDGVQDALNNTVETYRRNLWATQPYYVEVWVEKDAIAGIVAETANAFGVPVFVCRGFASLSSLYSAANTFKQAIENEKTVTIFHLGDHDPSGVAAGESVRRAFRDDFDVDLRFIRVAVTEEQIQQLSLPTRPTKMHSTHAKNWTGGESVELDAMPPVEIKHLVETCITELIDLDQWNTLKNTEGMERETLKQICANT